MNISMRNGKCRGTKTQMLIRDSFEDVVSFLIVPIVKDHVTLPICRTYATSVSLGSWVAETIHHFIPWTRGSPSIPSTAGSYGSTIFL